MGNFTYENQGICTYLVYAMTDEESIDSMSLGMITNNEIPGLAETIFIQVNSIKFIKYNISSRIPASQFFSGPITKKRLLGVFNGIVNAMLSAEEYMIDSDKILMDLNYVYADVSTCDTVLICLPTDSFRKDVLEPKIFFKNIMFSTQFDQTENCDYVTKIINYLNSSCMFSLADFKELIKELQEQGAEQIKRVLADDSVPNEDFAETSSQQLHNMESSVSFPLPPLQKAAVSTIPSSDQKLEQQVSSVDLTASDEKEMSLFYLLRHYDKENASIYKAQKEEKKQKKASKNTKKKKENGKSKNISSFAIPCQEVLLNKSLSPEPVSSAVSSPAMLVSPVSGIQTSGDISVQSFGQEILPAAEQPQEKWGNNAADTGMDFGNTVFMGDENDSEDTTIMMGMGRNSKEQQVRPHLIRRRNNERIFISKNVFRLGRNQDFNDYVIQGNDFVGNSHCHILVKGEECFIVDDNSKNHTLVNGDMVMPGSEIKLVHGQSVTLADEEFEFRLF